MKIRKFMPILMLATTAGACHHRPNTVSAIETVVVSPEPGELSPGQMAAIASRTARLKLVPDSISLTTGDIYDYGGEVHVVALDSAGAELGRLRVYDSRMDPGAAAMIPGRQLQALHPGASDLVVGFPRALWRGGGEPPQGRLHVTVRPRTAG